jgi:fructosamine-3-kinase
MDLLQLIVEDTGLLFTRAERVGGGDINAAWCLHAKETKCFLKMNDAALYPGMFAKEAAGLAALQKHSAAVVPKVIKQGVAGGQQYLLLEWIDGGEPGEDFWKDFGHMLAHLHQQEQPYFGWTDDNYIGSLPQINTMHANWYSFYAECRILPLVAALSGTGRFTPQDGQAAESVCKKLHTLFPEEPPALLHGDLWSGNYMVSALGKAAIYDPAVYFGHREMDIGMTKLFGGFQPAFYEAYGEAYPQQKGWQQRLPLTQLYPLLVHAVLFGGHYLQEAKEIIRRYS